MTNHYHLTIFLSQLSITFMYTHIFIHTISWLCFHKMMNGRVQKGISSLQSKSTLFSIYWKARLLSPSCIFHSESLQSVWDLSNQFWDTQSFSSIIKINVLLWDGWRFPPEAAADFRCALSADPFIACIRSLAVHIAVNTIGDNDMTCK